MYYQGFESAQESEILDAFLVSLKNIYPNAQVSVEVIQCQKPLGSKELDVRLSLIGNGDLSEDDLNNVLCSISEPQSNRSLQEQQFSEIVSAMVESVKKKEENEGKKRTTYYYFSVFSSFSTF